MKRPYFATASLLLATVAVGCQSSRMGKCPGGQCGLGGGCNGGACQVAADPYDAAANGARGGVLGPLVGQHHQGAQAHLGSAPGPAMGDPSPTYGYPYYTTRGPRDFLSSNPPSIGR